MTHNLELPNLSADPADEWQRMLRFAALVEADYSAMARTVEVLMQRSTELVVNTYDYLSTVPETAAILGWEQSVEKAHLEERRRFFTIWLARTLGLDQSSDFAYYLFRAGKFHAGQGPRRIHTQPAYVSVSVGMVLASFSNYMLEAGLPSDVIAPAMAGWSKYLSVQLNQMQMGYQMAQEFISGVIPIHLYFYARLREIIGQAACDVNMDHGSNLEALLTKFFNYFPQARTESLEPLWRSEEPANSAWVEVSQVYVPRRGWRVLLNGRDVSHENGFKATIHKDDNIAIFPPGR